MSHEARSIDERRAESVACLALHVLVRFVKGQYLPSATWESSILFNEHLEYPVCFFGGKKRVSHVDDHQMTSLAEYSKVATLVGQRVVEHAFSY
jgi:hypothetical protein